jgi:nucleoside-diphosphate-sugar epimerase
VENFVTGTVLRREPGIPLEGVRMSRHKMYVSSEKARVELGFNPHPVGESLRAAVDYFLHEWRPDSVADRVAFLPSGMVRN